MMKKSTQNTGDLRRFLLPVASLCLGLVVFAGTASLADKDESVLPGVPVASGESDSASGTTTSIPEFLTKHEQDSGRERKLAPTAGLQSQGNKGNTAPGAVEFCIGGGTVEDIPRKFSGYFGLNQCCVYKFPDELREGNSGGLGRLRQ